jgi:hypothetical protein
MTQKEFVKKESESYYGVKVEGKTFHFDDGLTKGLEIAKEFAEWVSELRNANAVMRIIDKRPADELLTIFLNEKYGK